MKPVLYGVVIVLFLSSWAYIATTAAYAALCKREVEDWTRKDRLCSTQLRLAAPLGALPSEHRRAAALYVQRGIARAGQADGLGAARDFRDAFARVLPGYDAARPMPLHLLETQGYRDLAAPIVADTTPEAAREVWVAVQAAVAP